MKVFIDRAQIKIISNSGFQNLIFKAIFERHIKAPDFDIFLADKNIYVSSKPKLS